MSRHVLALMLMTLCLTGCALGGRMFGGKAPDGQWEPDLDPEDKWSFVGKEARGNRALEDERDPFKKYLMSDEARAIERNLGYK